MLPLDIFQDMSTFSIQWIIPNADRFVLPQNRLFQVNSWLTLFLYSSRNGSQTLDILWWGFGSPTPKTKLADYHLSNVKHNSFYHLDAKCSARKLLKQQWSRRTISELHSDDAQLHSALANKISWPTLLVLLHKCPSQMRGKFLKMCHP
jgi:sulfite reductase alpha subunit-like flavoprotein